jgi:hypothetical protein
MELFAHQQEALNKAKQGNVAPIENWPGYLIDDTGMVYSFRDRIPNQPQGLIELKLTTDKDGYCVVTLRNHGRSTQGKVHRLVAEAFLPDKPEGKYLVRHLDGNPQNNHVNNLTWGTPKENAIDMIKHGRSLKGIKNHAAKLTPMIVKQIRELFSTGRTLQSLADQYGIAKGHASNICSRRVWKHV